MHFNIVDLNHPVILFVGREECGRARLTIGHIGYIFTLEVRVTRPSNAPVSTYLASAFLPCEQKWGQKPRASALHASTFPSRKNPVPQEKSQRDSHKPQARASAEYSARSRISGQPGHQSQKLPPTKENGYHLQWCHCPGKKAPEGPEAKCQCLQSMCQCNQSREFYET